jgi:hypothetical protein
MSDLTKKEVRDYWMDAADELRDENEQLVKVMRRAAALLEPGPKLGQRARALTVLRAALAGTPSEDTEEGTAANAGPLHVRNRIVRQVGDATPSEDT